MGERKLKAWVAAGLIDGATASRIRDWEAQHSRPLALWAVVGIAALSIGLGVISLVAANWDAIPGETRLALHAAFSVTWLGLVSTQVVLAETGDIRLHRRLGWWVVGVSAAMVPMGVVAAMVDMAWMKR